MVPIKKVEDLINKHSNLEKELSSGNVDKKLFAEKSKEYSDLNEIIKEAKDYISFEKNKNDLEKIINSELYKIYKFTAKVKYKKWPNTSIILDKRSFVGNSFLFKKVTGWKPKYSLRSAIRHYIHSKKITNK